MCLYPQAQKYPREKNVLTPSFCMLLSKTLKLDFLKNKEIFFLVSQVLSFRLKDQTSKNVVDTAFDNILRSTYPLLTFIQYLPYSVAELASVLSQLKQDSLPLFCDAWVFFILVEIIFQKHEELKSIVQMMGSFILVKAVKYCLGNFLKGKIEIFLKIPWLRKKSLV